MQRHNDLNKPEMYSQIVCLQKLLIPDQQMKTPRKRITFKTPRRGAKTPTKEVKVREHHASREGELDECLSPIPDLAVRYRQILSEMKTKEESLVESYKKENEYLRSLKTDALLYKKFVGFDIVENSGSYEVAHEVVSNDVTKTIRFVLTPDDGSYIYRLVESRNIDLPDFLSEEITFDESQIKTFFFKVMETIITKKG